MKDFDQFVISSVCCRQVGQKKLQKIDNYYY